jgi:hypothetical protein
MWWPIIGGLLISLWTSHLSQKSPAHRHSHFSQNRQWIAPHFRVWHLHRL